MCGFLGEVNLDGQVPFQKVNEYLDRLIHRGPDYGSVWHDSQAALGHRRLSILDLDPRAHQPMKDDSSGLVLIYNGEIYNAPSLRTELEKHSHSFNTHCDTEVLLKAWKQWGEHCLEKLDGMFAFAIWDPGQKKVSLARDRYGKKPIYYSQQGSSIQFASEIRALAAYRLPHCSIDPEAVELYFSFGVIPAPYSIYKEIKKLEPGSILHFSPSGIKHHSWYRLESKQTLKLEHSEWLERLETTLDQAVVKRLQSDVPLGVLLSGGVDSSLIACLMSKHTSTKSFSIGFEEQQYDESQHARFVAERLGLEHTEWILSAHQGIDLIPKIPLHYGEPYADQSAIPTLLVSQMASQKVKVALSGDGGDESAGGYDHYRLRPAALSLRKLLDNPNPDFKQLEDLSLKRNWLDKQSYSFLQRYRFTECPSLNYRAFFQGQDRISLLKQPSQIVPLFKEQLYRKSLLASDHPLSRSMWLDTSFYLPEDLLVKVDRASMAYSLELRCPLLDKDWIELLASSPSEWKVQGQKTKLPLKHLASKWLPQDLLNRPKQGFNLPDWFKGPLGEQFQDEWNERSKNLESFLNPAIVQDLYQAHRDGREKHETRLWSVYIFSLWLEDFQSGLRAF